MSIQVSTKHDKISIELTQQQYIDLGRSLSNALNLDQARM